MQESELYHWWQYYARSGKAIKSRGQYLRVLNSGMLNTSRGPDFISARFELDGIVYQGDVECHCKTSDWYAHSHQLDKMYRQVVLHLVGQPEGLAPVISQWNRQIITTVQLPRPPVSTGPPERYCQPGGGSQNQLKSNLMDLARIRFDQKIKYFMKALNKQNDQELFYIYFFRTLGYPANANTFQFLAEQLSWSWLMQHKSIFTGNCQSLFSVYAGFAGFIAPDCRDTYSEQIRQWYHTYVHILPGHSFDPEAWQYAGVRPNNHPHFRLAMALRILDYYNFQIYDTLNSILQSRQKNSSALREILTLFQQTPDDYWSTHFALGRKRKGAVAVRSLGKARIIELLINVILPLAAARASLSGSEGFLAYLQSFYLSLPLVSSYGQISKKIGWFADCFKTWPAQAVNQSLLSLQSEYCHRSLCRQCPVKRIPGRVEGKIIDNKIKNI